MFVKPLGAHAGGSNLGYDQVRKILDGSDEIPTLEPPSRSRAYRDVAVFGSDERTANLSIRRGKHYRLSLPRPSIDIRSRKECPGQRILHWYNIRSFMSLTCTVLYLRTMKPTNRMEKVIHAVASPRVYHGLGCNSEQRLLPKRRWGPAAQDGPTVPLPHIRALPNHPKCLQLYHTQNSPQRILRQSARS